MIQLQELPTWAPGLGKKKHSIRIEIVNSYKKNIAGHNRRQRINESLRDYTKPSSGLTSTKIIKQ